MREHRAHLVAARFGLSDELVAVEVSDEDLSSVLRLVELDRLAGLLSASVTAGSVVMSVDGETSLKELLWDQLRAAVLLEGLAVRVQELFAEADVDWLLTKGPAIAWLDYPNPNLRLFGDVDVLVHPSCWSRAVEVLQDSGFSRPTAEVSPAFDDRFGKGGTFVSAEGFEVDLHRRLAVGRYGLRLETEELFDESASLMLAGRHLPVPSGPARFLHACFHSALGGFRHFRARRDVAQLLLVSAIDWEAAVRVSSRHGVSAVLSFAIRDAWAKLGLTTRHPALAWALEHRTSWLDRRILAAFADESGYRTKALTALPDLLGHGAIAYIRPLIRRSSQSR